MNPLKVTLTEHEAAALHIAASTFLDVLERAGKPDLNPATSRAVDALKRELEAHGCVLSESGWGKPSEAMAPSWSRARSM